MQFNNYYGGSDLTIGTLSPFAFNIRSSAWFWFGGKDIECNNIEREVIQVLANEIVQPVALLCKIVARTIIRTIAFVP